MIESNEDTLLYASGHIPGAVNVDWTSDLNDQIRRDYITREGFESLMSRIGATKDTTVVFYGDKNNWWACYAFWVFQLFGHTNAQGDGRRPREVGKGTAPAHARRPSATRRATYKADERADAKHRAFRDEVLAHMQAKRQLVDVRSPDEYAGTRCTCRTIRTKGRCVAATSQAPRACRGHARSTRTTARSRAPTS